MEALIWRSLSAFLGYWVHITSDESCHITHSGEGYGCCCHSCGTCYMQGVHTLALERSGALLDHEHLLALIQHKAAHASLQPTPSSGT